MKKTLALLLAAFLLAGCAIAEQTPPAPPEGTTMQGTPPAMPEGEAMPPQGAPPQAPDGMGTPPPKPEGEPGGAPGGGMHSAPASYAAVQTVTEDAALTGELHSEGTDENLLHVQSGTATVSDATLSRTSADSAGGDAASFYGVGAAILATGGKAVVQNSSISTEASGGTGAFAYGDGVIYISDTSIFTRRDASGGIHVAGGGELHAKNLTVETDGESAAAIRSDRGGGVMTVDGGSYRSNGVGSPAVYVTADVSIRGATLTATGSEALCMEGLNTVRMFDCDLSGAMQDLPQNDSTWTVIVYQSMSGDSEVGKGRFEMSGGSLRSANGGLFYTTNTESEFVLRNVTIEASDGSEYFLRATGNANRRGWGASGANGANCVFTGLRQRMEGDVQWDSVSTLDMYVAEGSVLTGAVVNDESCAGEGGNGYCRLYVDASSSWIVTGDSRLSGLYCEGVIADEEGRSVTVLATDGSVLVQGDGPFTVTTDVYASSCDLSGMGRVSAWEDHAAEF